MLEHASALLAALGYGTDDGPFLEAGIGLDFGDAFVGNVGQRWGSTTSPPSATS